MIDIWQKQNPKKKEYTYFNGFADFKRRIDRFYLTSNIETYQNITTNIIQNYLSDHQIITINIHKKDEKKRSIILETKFQYLGKKDYRNQILSIWQKFQERKLNYQDRTVWWGKGKRFIQSLTKDFCTELKLNKPIYTNHNQNYNEQE